MTKQELRKKAMALPLLPGVYIMKNASGEIIYIGKAKVLRNRVSQYFGSQNNHTVKVRKMVENVNDFDYIIVNSEFEALVLECSLIKQNHPKYNILLKDDKGYCYIKSVKDDWKMIYFVRKKFDDGADYFGPYTSSEYVSSAVSEALDIFRLPHCNKVFPRDINKQSRPCLNYYINICSGACCGKIKRNEHNEAAESALKFILGSKTDILSDMKKQMLEASEALEFERAAKLRDRITTMEKVAQRQHLVSQKYQNQDVFGVSHINEKSCLCVLRFRCGSLTDTNTFVIDRVENPEEEYPEILTNFYSLRPDFPDRICVDAELSQSPFLEEYFSDAAGHKVYIYTPKSGETKALMDIAHKNSEEKLARILSYNDKRKAVLHELQEILGLTELPRYIESYDISNMNGAENVAGMIVYKDGRPDKKNYRRFMIKSFEGQDDYRSLSEVILRRINEYNLNPDIADGFGVKPDLILLDGGIGQVSAVRQVLEDKKFDVPLFGMVKDSKHRTRAIASDGGEISINDNRSVFSFISEIQEEVHRYAISYHHTLKKKNTLALSLTQIDGVGKTRAKELLLRFKTLSAVKDASVEELMTVKSMNEPTAVKIYNYFRNEKQR